MSFMLGLICLKFSKYTYLLSGNDYRVASRIRQINFEINRTIITNISINYNWINDQFIFQETHASKDTDIWCNSLLRKDEWTHERKFYILM